MKPWRGWAFCRSRFSSITPAEVCDATDAKFMYAAKFKKLTSFQRNNINVYQPTGCRFSSPALRSMNV